VSPGLSGGRTGGRVSWARLAGGNRPTYHDTKEAFLLDIPSVVFVNLDDLLNPCANGNEKPSRLGQLVDQLLRYHWGGCSNMNTVVRSTSIIACGWR
jgi:hypothetical protein